MTRLIVHLGNVTQWRTQVKLAVQPLSKWGGIKLGLYKAGSHIVEPIPNCAVHHPNINLAIDELKQHALQLNVRGYEEAKNGLPPQGELRYIQMSVERGTGMLMFSIYL
jgi:tRNA/tmRNA/rRNA uracil-C5-methylase (TrmA/RlmC/RlmD family)